MSVIVEHDGRCTDRGVSTSTNTATTMNYATNKRQHETIIDLLSDHSNKKQKKEKGKILTWSLLILNLKRKTVRNHFSYWQRRENSIVLELNVNCVKKEPHTIFTNQWTQDGGKPLWLYLNSFQKELQKFLGKVLEIKVIRFLSFNCLPSY